jgi:hypothetical protein
MWVDHEEHMPYIGDLPKTMCAGQMSKRKCVVRCLSAVLGVFVLVFLMHMFVQQLDVISTQQFTPQRAKLQMVTADQISQVEIVDRCVLPARQLDAFAQALHELTHFRDTPDPATYFGRLRMTLRSGRIQEYRLYQQSYGMVLELTPEPDSPTSQGSTSARSVEYVLSRTLVDVLHCEQTDVALR